MFIKKNYIAQKLKVYKQLNFNNVQIALTVSKTMLCDHPS